MSLYRLHIELEDNPEIIRVLDVNSDATFDELHKAILNAVNFTDGELASFFLCDEAWTPLMEITEIDMNEDSGNPPHIMSETKLSNIITNAAQKLTYTYDFAAMWNFRINIMDMDVKAEKNKTYPFLVSETGEAPDQFSSDKYPLNVSLDDEALIAELARKNHSEFSHSDDEFSSDEWEDSFEEDEFGSSKEYGEEDY